MIKYSLREITNNESRYNLPNDRNSSHTNMAVRPYSIHHCEVSNDRIKLQYKLNTFIFKLKSGANYFLRSRIIRYLHLKLLAFNVNNTTADGLEGDFIHMDKQL